MPLSPAARSNCGTASSSSPAGCRPISARTKQGKRAGSHPKIPLTSRVALARQHAKGRVQTNGRTGRARSTGPKLDWGYPHQSRNPGRILGRAAYRTLRRAPGAAWGWTVPRDEIWITTRREHVCSHGPCPSGSPQGVASPRADAARRPDVVLVRSSAVGQRWEYLSSVTDGDLGPERAVGSRSRTPARRAAG